MTAISAAAMRCRTMADGSLRIEVEVEPNDAQAAFNLFGKPGAPMAIAALVVGHAAVEAPLKGGPLSRAAGMLDNNAAFREWIGNKPTREFILEFCAVSSRRELDHDIDAANRFHLMMSSFNVCRNKQATA